MPTNRLDEHWAASTEQRLGTAWLDEEPEKEPGEYPWLDRIEELLCNHPRTAVIAALAVGLTLGWLGKRK